MSYSTIMLLIESESFVNLFDIFCTKDTCGLQSSAETFKCLPSAVSPQGQNFTKTSLNISALKTGKLERSVDGEELENKDA